MPRLARVAALALLAVLPLAGAPALTGCDGGGPSTCGDGGALQTTDLAVGEGDAAARYHAVRIAYTARLEGGDVFQEEDSVDFFLPRYIEGFRQGVTGMREGGRRRIVVPPDLAYGPAGFPAAGIPGCATIVYEVELFQVLPPQCVDGEGNSLEGDITTTDVTVGSGDTAAGSSTVTVDYVGRFADGTVFDEASGARFDLFDVIPGFRDGVAGMKEGGRRTIVIPPNLAYGTAGRPGATPAIPRCATLTFDVTLHEVN